jgi:multiple antibiotic resistance protein
MIESALTSFTTIFATVGPVEAAVLFATLTPKMPHAERAAIALRATRCRSSAARFTLLRAADVDRLRV